MENNKQDEPINLFPDAMIADVKSVHVTSSIVELFTNGEMSAEAFARLYGASRDADTAVRKVVELVTQINQEASQLQDGERPLEAQEERQG